MNFYQIWLTGYISPAHFSEELREKPAPIWGFWVVMLRAALISLLMYLPLYLNGVVPPTSSYLSFISTE